MSTRAADDVTPCDRAAVLVTPAHDGEALDQARLLFREYAASLPFALAYQGFEAELAGLPGRYAPPRGALLLARGPDARVLGCVGVRPLDQSVDPPGACEMKRLYVRPAARGTGAGRVLAEAAVAFAEAAGYGVMLLDTLPVMAAAVGLYRALGFAEVPPYWEGALPGTLYFARRLRQSAG